MLKILRPARHAQLVSARVFDNLFKRHVGEICDIQVKPLIEWCREVLGPPGQPFRVEEACKRFLEKTRGYDFFCPGYECIFLAPIFMDLRNRSGSDIRLLFIAHAPGAYAMEWVLLRPLLVPGDLIVAPSNNGKATIQYLCSELSPFVKAINHPMQRMPRHAPLNNNNIPLIVTLSRVEEKKLIHRQIEALDCLRKQGITNIKMKIAGPLKDPQTNRLTSYVRSLQMKIHRLGLDEQVELIDAVEGQEAKAAFLSGAKMMICLSQTVEEAYPKASIEALGMGIPVVGTRWNGLPETVGEAGLLIPFHQVRNGSIDVKAQDLADAVIRMLDAPISPDRCIRQAEKFLPEHAKKKYSKILHEAAAFFPSRETGKQAGRETTGASTERAFVSGGLLGRTACLKPFSWQEIFRFYRDFSHNIRKRWERIPVHDICPAERIYHLVSNSTKKPLEYFLAGLDYRQWMNTFGRDREINENEGDFFVRILEGIYSDSNQHSKEICLALLLSENRPDLLEKGLKYMKLAGRESRGLDFLNNSFLLQKKNYTEAYNAFNSKNKIHLLKEDDAPQVGQIARICREMGNPVSALPWLRQWLHRYPDTHASGQTWLDRAMNAFYSGEAFFNEASVALEKAKQLLGESEEIISMSYNIYSYAAGFQFPPGKNKEM